MHKKRRKLFILSGLLLIGGGTSAAEDPGRSGDDRPYGPMAKFTAVLEQVRHHYVTTNELRYEELVTHALDGMLQALDPYSRYMEDDEYTRMKDDMEGRFGGVGVVISSREGMLTIVAPIEDTPAFEAGLLPGDRIVAIDGDPVEGVSLDEASSLLRGEPGTPVKLKVYRPENESHLSIEIVRDEIEVSSVKDAAMAEEGIAYVRLTQFDEPAAERLREELRTLRDEGMKALVLDLRGNPGGLLRSAVTVSELFLDRGDDVVRVRGRREEEEETYRITRRPEYPDMPMAVLINGGSASASEIVAGALQDHDRAVLIGAPSFGKGSVQSLLPLDDGSALRLTTALYYTPSNRCIHEVGLTPDIEVPMEAGTWRRIRMAHLQEAEGGEPDAPADLQMERALGVLKGILIDRGRAH
ncbi:S41 family peptidase [Kiritimatiella glycovorans]|uniref:Carboxy-terminal processing protease CtpA n=1 Tax=Kiritimatiella glycovorans TaxID=1307763 RepID=A0A0G3EHD8_9BACT|nr:S41 family peptidase [Kiritimatiella glycovorans]AKJ64255.1 Carboxy-terminal processing protease CtpA precursor [Kiritimatiella glycovorans]